MVPDPVTALSGALDGLQVRVAQAGDRSLLRQIVSADAAQMLAGIPAAARAVLVSAQTESRLPVLVRRYPGAITLLLGEEMRTVGLMLLDWPPAGIVTLLDLTLLPGLRRQGRGTKALSALCAAADLSGRTLRAGLFYDNPARRLFTRAGFALTGDETTDIVLERSPTGTCRPVNGFLTPLPPSGDG